MSTGRMARAAFVALGLPSCQAFVGDYSADLEESPRVDSAPLCQIERERFVLELDLDSDAAETSLEAYYERANPALVEHLGAVVDAYQAGSEYKRITYVRGAAGVGKSFMTRHFTDSFTESEQCGGELVDLFANDPGTLGFDVELKADLMTLDRSTVFNELPSIVDVQELQLETLLAAAGCYDGEQLRPLIVLDGIDEVHDDTATQILHAVDQFVLDGAEGSGDFIHFLIAGRPEGFAGWLIHPGRHDEHAALVDQFDLLPPEYTTAGDIDFRVRGYLDFQRDPPLPEAEVESFVDSVTQALGDHPFLTYSMGNLAVGNVVIEQAAPDLEFSEQSLKRGLFDDILLRNVGTHGRPGADSEHEGAYRRALEDIAARYADVDAGGRFTVHSEDTIEAFDDAGESLGLLRVRNVLDRAGVAFLTEPVMRTTRYRFDPFWVHGHLIERRNQRLIDDYSPAGCE